MRKPRLFFIAVLVLLGAFLLWKNPLQDTTTRVQNYEFGMQDTASITRIELTTKKPDTAILSRTEDGWLVNNRYIARSSGINTLLRTLHDQEMKHFVAKDRMDRVVKYMATGATEVKVFNSQNERVMHFFVGGNTPDQLGTYMMNTGADQPYAVHIPGFNGFLSSRYFTEEHLWRSKTILALSSSEIERIEMRFPMNPEASFAFNNEGEQFYLFSLGGEPIANADSAAIAGFVQQFEQVLIEGWIQPEDRVWAKKDSILNSTPEFELIVFPFNGAPKTIKGYRKLALEGETDAAGNLREYDKDRFYAQSPEGDLVLIQRYAWSALLRDRTYFIKSR